MIYLKYSPSKHTANTDKHRHLHPISLGNKFHSYFCIFATEIHVKQLNIEKDEHQYFQKHDLQAPTPRLT